MEAQVPIFSENPILNSPYDYPGKHWELDRDGHPTGKIIESRRPSSNRSPIAPAGAKGARDSDAQGDLFNETVGDVDYREHELIQSIREEVNKWRKSPESQWHVTAETARLLKHWRSYDFPSYRPFFCQIEATETLIWLTEVAPSISAGKSFLQRILDANTQSDAGLYRIALKLATGAGKTTVMAMIIAWQTINAKRHGVGEKFTNGFLITTPGLTIRDRLRVLLPNDRDSYYGNRQLVPQDFLPLMSSARIVITNYHAYALKETLPLASGTRAILIGPCPTGAAPQTRETPGQMLRRVMPDLIGLKNILMINDEAHHCYRRRPDGAGKSERALDADEKEEAKRNEETARVWISGLEAVRGLMPKAKVIDLSATPFFLRGSGYEEGTLFNWTVCDFSLMDALECGIVKLPRIPLDDNIVQPDELPKYRDLWKNLKKTDRDFCRIRVQNKNRSYNPELLPHLLRTAIEVLYGHYEKVNELWKEAGIKTPPCFIFVCQNTAISKLVYDFVSGYCVTDAEGNQEFKPAACRLFSNYGDDCRPLSRPNTLLIDSFQLESGDALGKEFRAAAEGEIERYRSDMGRVASEKITDEELLREVMNTVGKEGRLGEQIRCVVSVSMLTEGWDANNVTHILGVRAFGTQLLCEQVVGRALRRLNYETDRDTGLYRPDYADIFGIPFSFVSGVKDGAAIRPPDFVHVHAIHPDRDALTIRFPHVIGYYVKRDAVGPRLTAAFSEEHAISISKAEFGPTLVQTGGAIGSTETMRHPDDRTRKSEIVYHLAQKYIATYPDAGNILEKSVLFEQIRPIVAEWLAKGFLRCGEGVPMGAVLREQYTNRACEMINNAIVRAAVNKPGGASAVCAIIDGYNPSGSTLGVNFRVSRNSKTLHETSASKCHINYAVCDFSWEPLLCRVLEGHPQTIAYVKNSGLCFEVPYYHDARLKKYLPDFIVLVDDGHGRKDPLNLVIEVKGYRREDADVKKLTMETYWIPGVNNLGRFGRWRFAEMNEEDFGSGGKRGEEDCLEACRRSYAALIAELTAGGPGTGSIQGE